MDPVLQELLSLRAKVDSLIQRAVITKINDSTKTQNLQVELSVDEIDDQVEHLQPYGLSFNPPVGSECIYLNSSSGVPIIIGTGDPDSRPTGAPSGTGGLYTAQEWRVFIDENGIVHIGAQSGAEFVALATKVLNELNAIRTAFDAHTHVVSTTGTAAAQSGTAAAVTSPLGSAGSVAATKAKAT